MNINKLNYLDAIDIHEEYYMPEEFVKSTDIISIDPVLVDGTIDANYNLFINVSGVMYLKESFSLEKVPYKFAFTIEENIANNENYLKNNGNTLDLGAILWENIILEIPMNVVLEKRTNIKGDGWELKEENIPSTKGKE